MRSDAGRRARPVTLEPSKLAAALVSQGWKMQDWLAKSEGDFHISWWDRGPECVVVVTAVGTARDEQYSCLFTPVVSLRRARSLLRSSMQQGELFPKEGQ